MRRSSIITLAVLAAAAIGAPDASAARVYAGQPAGQAGFQSVLALSNNGLRVTGLTFHFDVSCGQEFRTVDFGSAQVVDDEPGAFLAGAHYLVGSKISGNRLTATLTGVDSGPSWLETMNASLSGTISKTRISGRVAVRFVDINPMTGAMEAQCSQTIAWKALRKPGIVFGGKTSQDEPVVLELTATRKSVSHAHVSWFAPCRSGDLWTEQHDEFDLKPFRLSPSGAFSRTYAFSFADDITELERFAGKVSRTRAAGTFRGDVTVGGSQPDECSSGAVSWRAATG